ncbi:MAG: N-acetyl-alpha-D-glucosaminyl L-malate synthase BshA, partial [Bacteroidota bacterium]
VFYHEVTVADYPLFEFAPYETALTSKLVDVAKFEKLDLVHVHYAVPHASVAYMAKQILLDQGIRLPFITTLHGTDITLVGRNASYSPVVTFGINQSDAVTSVSQSLRDETYRNFLITKEIHVIPNFIDLHRFNKMKKDHFRKAIAPNNERILIHASNFRPVKRISDVLAVFEKIRSQLPCKLLLIGDGPERNRIEQECRESQCAEHIRFLGKLDAVEEVLSVGDLFLLPSESESFGLAALEAMACQVPVISSNTGGLPEVNVDGVTGFMSNVGDVDDMSQKALRILKDEQTLSGFKKRALDQAKQFDIRHILPMYSNLYEKVLKG